MHGIAIPHAVISSAARNLFHPLFPDFFAKPFTGSTAPAFPRYAVSHFSPSDALRLTANENDPSAPLPMTIRETRHFPHILCMMHGIAIPHAVISSAARNLFRPLFPTTPSLSRLWETPSTFPRYGVSHFSPSDALRLTANEKDPSTSLPMTIRETRLFHFPRYGVSVSCYQTCTINKRAMNKTVHGSFICTPAGIIPNP